MAEISVIVPVYNVENYLHRCVDSILAQTFRDFELILVDDGSPDNCGKICDDYAARDSRVIVIHKENGGVSVARNVGTSRAMGNYVTYIDADDWITQDYLERLYNAVIEFGAEVSVTHPIVTDDENASGKYTESNNISMNSREAILRYAEENSNEIRAPWGKLIQREIAQSVRFPAGRHYAEDTACVYQWYWKAKRIIDVQDKLYFYCLHSDSLSHDEGYSEKKLGEYDTLSEMISFFSENGFDELYQDYICEYLARAVGAYQYLLADNSQMASQLYAIIKNAMKNYLHTDTQVEDYRQLLDYYREKNPKYLRSFVKMMIRRLAMVVPVHLEMMDNKELAISEKRFLRMLLLRYGIQYNFFCEAYPTAYEVAFPHLMKYYWIISAQFKKLRLHMCSLSRM